MKAISQESHAKTDTKIQDKEEKKLRLRAELLSVFEIFQKYRKRLNPNNETYHQLSEALREVSANSYQAYQKGYLSEKDIEEVRKELEIIEKELIAAKLKKTRLVQGKIASRPFTIPGINLTHLQPQVPQNVTVEKTLYTLPDRTEGKKPAEGLEAIQEITPIALFPYNKIETSADFLKSLRTLKNDWETSNNLLDKRKTKEIEILRFFSEIPLELFISKKKPNQLFWWNMSTSEMQEAMQIITNLTTELSSQNKFLEDLNQFTMEAFFKASAIILFLETKKNGCYFFHNLNHLRVHFFHYQAPDPITDLSSYFNTYQFKGHNYQQIQSQSAACWSAISHTVKGIEKSFPKVREEKLFPFTKIQLNVLDKLTGQEQSLPNLSLPSKANDWMRPIYNPFLLALYRQATTWIDDRIKNVSEGKKELIGEKFGLMSSEAFQTDPQGVFSYFLEDFNHTIEHFKSEQLTKELNQHSKPPSELLHTNPTLFTLADQKRLLMLLRLQDPHGELIAFMKDCPHLMRQADVRNFFDALFFNGSLLYLLKKKDNECWQKEALIESIPLKIQAEISRLEAQLKTAIEKKPIEDPILTKERLDLLLYYYEMEEKLKQIYKSAGISIVSFQDNNPALYKWREFTLQNHSFHEVSGVIARIHLRQLLAVETILSADLPEILLNYMIVHGSKTHPKYLEPSFESLLDRHWQQIVASLEANPQSIGEKNWQILLDHYCYIKNMPLDGSTWQQQEGLIFTNKNYQVDLAKLRATLKGFQGEIDLLPVEITNQALFQATFPDLFGKSIRVNKQKIGDVVVYSFADSYGKACQIEESQGSYTFYKKIDIEGGKWIQSLSMAELAAIPKQALEKTAALIKKKRSSPLALFKMLLKAKQEISNSSQPSIPYLLDQGFFIDPANALKGYSINKQGEVLFEIHFKTSQKGLALDKVIDCRENPATGPWQLNHLGSSKKFDFLQKIENKENMLFWSQKNVVKKVELPRFGLKFSVENGYLKCLNHDLKDYFITEASLAEKQGFPHALILEHPDKLKPRKLLVPESDALIPKLIQLKPKAIGLAKLWLLIENLIQIFKMIFGSQPKALMKVEYRIDPARKTVRMTTFDLRPFTNEICEKEKNWSADLLELASQALKTSQPLLAFKMLQKLPLDKAPLDQKTLNSFIHFIKQPGLKTGGEAAIKLKLCLHIKHALQKHKQLTKELRQILHKQVLHQSKFVLAAGQKIPPALRLNEEERLLIAKLAKKKEPLFYEQILQTHVTKEEIVEDPLLQAQDIQLIEKIKIWKKDQPQLDISSRINALEAVLEPLEETDLSYPIPKLADGQEISLLFTPKEVDKYFKKIRPAAFNFPISADNPDLTTCEVQALKEFKNDIDAYSKAAALRTSYQVKVGKHALDRFLKTKISSKKTQYENQAALLKAQILAGIRQAEKADEQLAIYASMQPIASFDELRKALAQNSLEELQKSKRLPAGLDLLKLKKDLGHYFDTLTRRNALAACERIIKEMQNTRVKGGIQNSEQWESLSTALYKLLTIERHYDGEADPRFLIFEAQQFINFKPLEGGLEQINLLEALLKDPHAIVQAPTGAGKTSVLSVMRSLLKANGKNLVIQKVLPALYEQTYDKLHDVLGDLYGISVYPLRFNLKMRLTTLEVVPKIDQFGKKIEIRQETSIFKGMYHEMLQTMQHHGCILTDYKSLPLLEEKFWRLGQDFVDKKVNGEAINSLEREHFTYLQKILQLLHLRADENMDEFDQPNRPIHKVQLELGTGAKPIPSLMIDTSLEIYEELLKDEKLALAANIQGDLTPAMRQSSIEQVAKHFAKKYAEEGNLSPKALLDYLLGKNEELLKELDLKNVQLNDKIALCKDQFTTYLKLCLSYNGKSRYDRSEDGTRTVPCYNGEKHVAKFGTILEQVNYTIQDYLQQGITALDLRQFTTELKNQWEDAEDEAKRKAILNRLHAILPGKSIVEAIKVENSAAFVKEINRDPQKIIPFLKLNLSQLKTSGQVVSMDPQNIIDMSRVVSGTSATMGASESLHRQFAVNQALTSHIRGEQTLRLCRRALKSDEVIHYDPANPEQLIEQANKKYPLTAIIDGAGAFKNSSKATAEKLLQSNPTLQQVGFHSQEAIVFAEKNPSGNLNETGFFFNQAHTRGTDIKLAPQAVALLTLSDRDGLREYFQKEGRLRQDTQRYLLALPKYQSQITNITEEIIKAVCNDANIDAQDIFRKCKQEAAAILRKGAKQKLLASESAEDFVDQFQAKTVRELFISSPSNSYNEDGDYFKMHQHLRKEDCSPLTILNAYNTKLKEIAAELDLEEVIKQIDHLNYSPELIAKMPQFVASLNAEELEMELEIEAEEEEEQEHELQLEIQNELETQQVQEAVKPIGNYPIRRKNEITHSLSEMTHVAYDPRIKFSDSFWPLSRKGTSSTHQRDLFDPFTYPIGLICINLGRVWTTDGKLIEQITIEDPLEDSNFLANSRKPNSFFYDIRTEQITTEKYTDLEDLQTVIDNPEFKGLIAQIKFTDGKTSGYSVDELAALGSWIKDNDPAKLRDYFLNKVLRNRYADKQSFSGSQLDQLFNELMADNEALL